MLALGSGDLTRAICTMLIAQAFQSVRYPILPRVETLRAESSRRCRHGVREVLHIRHHSLFAPRDFDVSLYFQVVKPLLEGEFDYRDLTWEDQAHCGGAFCPLTTDHPLLARAPLRAIT